MNNPEKLATYSTQDTGQHKTLENTEGEIKMNNPEKLATYSTQDTGSNKR